MSRAILYGLAGLAAGFLAAYILQPEPDLSPYQDPVVVSHRDITRNEPDTTFTFVVRMTHTAPAPIVREVSPQAGTPDVSAFCRAAVEQALAAVVPDSTPPAPSDTSLLLRSVSYDRGWFLGPDRVTVLGPTSVGDLYRAEYRMRGGGLRVHADSLVVRTSRFGLAQDLIEIAVPLAVGYGLGRLF